MGNIRTKLKFYALFGYLIFFGLKAYALTNFDEAQLFSMNVIQNGGFESDKAFWLQTSGQAFFVTSVQSEVGSGLKSAKLMGPGLQRIKGELFPIPNSMKTSTTCILRCQWLNTTGAVGSCYAEDSGGAPILGASIPLAAGANWQQSDVSFTCPASGSFRAVVEATPGSGNSVFVDQIYIGPTVTGSSGGGGGPFIPLAGSNMITGSLTPQNSGVISLGDIASNTRWLNLAVDNIIVGDNFGALAPIGQLTISGNTFAIGTSAPAKLELSTGGAGLIAGVNDIDLLTASSAGGNRITGDIRLETGASTGGGAFSGNIFLTTGQAPSGTQGSIFMNESSLGAAVNGYVWTLQDNTTGEGAWAANPASGGLVEINPLGTPYLVTALDASTNGLSPSLVNQRGVYNIQSDSAGVRNMTVNPQINGCNGGNLMKELVVRGTSATQRVRFNNGNGMRLQSGSKVLGNGGTLNLYCDGVDWVEK